jgi:hypothetical protein
MEQTTVLKSKNNYTSLPEGVPDWKAYEDWVTYDNTEFIADKNFAECWGDVDTLKEKFGEVYLINLNSGPAIRSEEGAKRYCFGFDYAIACSTEAQKRKLKRLMDAYRHIGTAEFTTDRAYKLLVPVIDMLNTFPHVESHFS